MTEAECRAEIRKFFMELYPACTVIYAYPGNAARPPAPYVVLDFDAADSSQIDESKKLRSLWMQSKEHRLRPEMGCKSQRAG